MKTTTISTLVTVLVLGLLVLNSQTALAGSFNLVGDAACFLQPDPKSPLKVSGTIEIRDYNYTGATQVFQLLELSFKVSGLEHNPDELRHGFHVHEYGDISQGCGSTGGHYNPLGKSHGGFGVSMRHIGDLGNVRQDEYGNIKLSCWFSNTASLFGEHSIIGRAFVLHAGKDDLGRGGDAGSKATGNAGARLGCCVIGWAKPDGGLLRG